jgi:hypothetical protein
MPDSLPWVNFRQVATSDIGSDPLPVFNSAYTSKICSIITVNKTDEPFLLDFNILKDNGDTTPLLIKKKIEAYETQDFTFKCLIMEGGDTILANAEFSGNRFACIVCYEELLESVL